MDLASLAAFVAVAEHGGFSAAAEQLHLTQPAVSKRIAQLEEELGTRLLDRLRAGFEHAEKGVMSQILRLLTVAQAAGPGPDQLIVIFKKTRPAGHFTSHCSGLQRWGVNSNASY